MANFGAIAEAPNGVAKLRELVFKLACSGRLTSGLSGDDKVAENLLKSDATRDSAIASKKIRKGKPLRALESDAPPFEVPQHWDWVRLGRIVEYNAGSRVKGEAIEADAWLLELEDIEKTSSTLLARVTARERSPKSSKSTFRKGDVLYGKLRPYLDKVIVASSDGYCTTEIVPLRSFGAVTPEYLRLSLKRPDFIRHVVDLSYGMNLPRLGTEDGRNAFIPLPPLAEQKRIVAKVEQLVTMLNDLEERQKRKQTVAIHVSKASLDSLVHAKDPDELACAWERISKNFTVTAGAEASFKHLAGTIRSLAVRGRIATTQLTNGTAQALLDQLRAEQRSAANPRQKAHAQGASKPGHSAPPFSLPSPRWTWTQLAELAEIGTSVTYGVLKPVWVEKGVPTVRVQDMKRGEIDLSHLAQCDPERASKFEKTMLCEGDLLIAKDGATLGKTAFVPAALAGGNITQHVLRFSISRRLSREYIRLVIDSPHGQGWMSGETKGVALPGVNVGDFRRMPIPLPPRAEQDHIVSRAKSLLTMVRELSQLHKARARVASKMATALSGG